MSIGKTSRKNYTGRVNLEEIRASLNTRCVLCGYEIPPSKILHVDMEQLRCPKCGKDFVPERKGRKIATS
jgi:predicted RNA-binding Zn-ribbon protein involved in translation (DUF1610 family)